MKILTLIKHFMPLEKAAHCAILIIMKEEWNNFYTIKRFISRITLHFMSFKYTDLNIHTTMAVVVVQLYIVLLLVSTESSKQSQLHVDSKQLCFGREMILISKLKHVQIMNEKDITKLSRRQKVAYGEKGEHIFGVVAK